MSTFLASRQAMPADRTRRPRDDLQPASSARRPVGPGARPGLAALQRLVGNRTVTRMLSVQRCGSTPPEECDCHGQAGEEQDHDRPPAVQRSAVSGGEPLVVQRHEGFRVKPRLETEVLGIPELQTAASAAERALESGQSRGGAVERLQEALNTAGFDTAITSVFDRETQRAVAAFQAAHGIPFPSGRQAGPKTLSTLDDHLLGAAPPKPPNPPNACDTYLPGEREASLVTPGTFERGGGLGLDLRLTNFGAGRGRMKPEHESAIVKFVKEFDLFEPEAAVEVEFVRGFTDGVDAEERNALLREERAIDVEFVLKANGVPNTPQAQAAAEGSYDAGCDPSGRTAARAVLVRLRKKAAPPPKPKPQPKVFGGCGAPLNARLEAALPEAVSNLNTAVRLLSARPLTPEARDALFVYFRRDDEPIAGQVAAALGKAAAGLASAPAIDCRALVGCDASTHAVTNPFTRTIHICNGGALDPDQVNLERTLMHEGMHLSAGMGPLGERSHGAAPDCDEGDLAGQTTGMRLANADSYAALAVRMAKSPVAGIRRSSEHFHGNDIALATVPKGATTVRLADNPQSPRLVLNGISDLAPTMQWRLTDSAGRHYLLLNLQGEVIAPDQATDATVGIIGRQTRDLLAARGVANAVLSVHARNQAGLDRTVSLTLSFVP